MEYFNATAWPPFSRTTPFGLPVVPDVYKIYSGSVPLTATQSAGVAFAIASAQSISMPSCIAALACGRCSTTQHSGLWADSSMALSTSGLYSITLATSIPHDAVTISFGSASSIRTANSCGAKPPNTTEWMAPRRAIASMATTASVIIGMYTTTRSPFSTPWAFSTPANSETCSCSCA